MVNLEVIHTGTSILYDWDILESSIYIVDILRIDDLRIDDQSSILRLSIYRVFPTAFHLKKIEPSNARVLINNPAGAKKMLFIVNWYGIIAPKDAQLLRPRFETILARLILLIKLLSR